METMKQSGRGGARPGAGRPKGSKTRKPVALSGKVDPVAVLEEIAADETAPHAARVSAAKALLDRGRPPAEPAKDRAPGAIVWLKRAEA
ncbi:hypothetical protein LG047_00480 [Methylocystis sp. WRRC1]|uniref:hypothetical protein n=1 Tax=Methylocystis sp. WRRC1 TaxID=1732014 RepID=UPI001D14D5AC|nr:hypothetical protein [Methylocystis sp. WRRC1]MCC3243812.1 hypothetical protein [Methylocystis sp. WRRC1]